MSEVDVLSMFKQIGQKIEANKSLGDLTREQKITSLGIDSVSMMEIIGCMEDELDISIPDEKLAQMQTVGDIERAVLEQVGGQA